MTITASFVNGEGTEVDDNEFITGDVTPTSNNLQLLQIHVQRGSSTNPSAPSSIVGCSLTWVLVRSEVYDTTGTERTGQFLYRALGVSPSMGGITMTFSYTFNWIDIGHIELANVDLSGTNGSGAIVQHVGATGSDASPSVTLSAFSNSANATVGVYAGLAGGSFDVFDPGTGFTELTEGSSSGEGHSGAIEFRDDNDTTVTGTIDSADLWSMFGLEIKSDTPASASSSGAFPSPRSRRVLMRS